MLVAFVLARCVSGIILLLYITRTQICKCLWHFAASMHHFVKQFGAYNGRTDKWISNECYSSPSQSVDFAVRGEMCMCMCA